MKKIVIGILAHVDAGKTTLSESMLYLSGAIRKLGRVDNKDAFLDTFELERMRGITIFSKQAEFQIKDTAVTLLDTPGHVDFSAEMERTLQVLDYAILVVSGTDGVQGHTLTLWRLLKSYQIPVFLFINKMDQKETSREQLMNQLKERLDGACVDFSSTEEEEFFDALAMCEESMMNAFLETGSISINQIRTGIRTRQVFPCFFGSALKLSGVEEFLKGIENYMEPSRYPEQFGAQVFKITRDSQGNRLTYLKITGGCLHVKDVLSNRVEDGMKQSEIWEEKVNQIRIYSGEKFESVLEVGAGSICAVTGLTKTYPGECFGIQKTSKSPMLEPVLSYQIIPMDGMESRQILPKLRLIEEEEPELHIVWNETLQEIQAQLMGEVQIEILQSMLKERFDLDVEFGTGNIVYKETITNTVEGVGHFEPLRHYAEVHVILEPAKPGSGVTFDANCSEDLLDRNWQRLILTHLYEKQHVGVLTGSEITDMKITLVAGRAHKKHTEGGDFREATYRAVRHGLKQANSILLEPYYSFTLEIPEQMVGRAMTDVERMCGSSEVVDSKDGFTTLRGSAPVVTMKNYQKEVLAYTKGHGRLFCSLKGYEPCHNEEEIVLEKGYDSERDVENPTGSVFCAHGAGFLVPWDHVTDYMHIEGCLKEEKETIQTHKVIKQTEELWIDHEEIDQIIEKTFYANRGNKTSWKKERQSSPRIITNNVPKKVVTKEEYLLVDGYNVIFAWDDLNELAKENIDSARDKLIDELCNYQGIRNNHLMVVFDAYRIENHATEVYKHHNIYVVFTKEAETADQYIEKFVHENSNKYQLTVATSDGLEQIIIRGQGCGLLSARELKEEMNRANQQMMQEFTAKKENERNYLFDSVTEETDKKLKEILFGED